MTTQDLDRAFMRLCETMEDFDEDRTKLFLARYALLMTAKQAELDTVLIAITEAAEGVG